jgi:AcrR family transcriptional regulator
MNRRQQQHAQTRTEVKAIARQQMAEQGTAALSLRAIAREMGLTAQALYRYFPSRDDLITALIVDAFTAHGAAVQQAVAALPADDLIDRLWAFIEAYRAWALTNPLDFQLIYGNPIPDYHAPEAVTGPVAAHATAIGFVTLQQAIDRCVLVPPPAYRDLPAAVRDALVVPDTLDGQPVSPTVMYLGTTAWAMMQGLIMLELFGHIQAVVRDPAAFYRHQMADLLQRIGLPAAPGG